MALLYANYRGQVSDVARLAPSDTGRRPRGEWELVEPVTAAALTAEYQMLLGSLLAKYGRNLAVNRIWGAGDSRGAHKAEGEAACVGAPGRRAAKKRERETLETPSPPDSDDNATHRERNAVSITSELLLIGAIEYFLSGR